MSYDQVVFILCIAAFVISSLALASNIPPSWTWRDLRHAFRVAAWAFNNYAQLCGLKVVLTNPETFSPFPAHVHAQTVRNLVYIYMEDFPSEP